MLEILRHQTTDQLHVKKRDARSSILRHQTTDQLHVKKQDARSSTSRHQTTDQLHVEKQDAGSSILRHQTTDQLHVRQRDAAFTFVRKDSEILETTKDIPKALAHLKMSEASASVSFREDEFLWGLLGKRKAGILQFQVNRGETRNCKIRDLTIKLSFDKPHPNSSKKLANVYLLQHPAPRSASGDPKITMEETDRTLNPNVPTSAGNLSMGSLEKKSNSTKREVWTYKSDWEPVDRIFRTAIWRYLAKDSDLQLEGIDDLHGAIVIGGHEGQPFYVCCRLEGKLVTRLSWPNRRWFLYRSRENDPSTFYDIDPTVSESQSDFQKYVDELETKLKTLMRKSKAGELISKFQ